MAKNNVIRDLLVRLGVLVKPGTKKDLDDLDKQIERTKEGFESLAMMALKLGAALAAGAVAAATAAGVLAVQTGEQAIQIERQARALNLTRGEYQELKYVFESFGADAGEIADVFQQINDKAVEAQAGSTSVVAEFKLLGITTAQLKGKRPHEIFDLIADGSANAADKQKAMAGVSKLLGEDSAKKLAPALAMGSKEIRRMRNEAESLGLVMRDDQLRVAKETAMQWRRLTSIAKGLRNELGVALAPMVTKVFVGLSSWVTANRALLSQQITAWVNRLEWAIGALNAGVRLIGGWDKVFLNVAIGTGLLLLIANLSTILDLIENAKIAFGFLRTAAAAFGITTMEAFWPVTLIVAAAVAYFTLLWLALEDVYVHLTGGKSALGEFLDALEYAVPVFGAFRDMMWSLVQLLGGMASNVLVVASGLLRGLAPALNLIGAVVEPVLRQLTQLLDLWREWNEQASKPFRGVTEWAQGQTYVADNNARGMAASLQNQVANKLQPGIDRLIGGGNNTSNAWTQNQQISFSGFGGGQREIEAALNSANRKAFPAVQGGPR